MENTTEPEDLLSDSLQSLYDYTPITHSSAGSIFRYTLPPGTFATLSSNLSRQTEPLTITLTTPTTQAGNWSLHASSIWASSIYVADHLCDLNLDQHIAATQRMGRPHLRVLELGAGAGLPSILIAKIFGDVLVNVSDYPDDELIAAMKSNVEANKVSSRCRTVPYAWGSDPSVFAASQSILGDSDECDHTHDVVIAADTLWNSELHSLFLQALQNTLRKSPDARIYLVAGLHTGRYTLHTFMNAVPQYGFEFVELEERSVSGTGSPRRWDVGRSETEDDKERRRWVIWIVLKWQ